MRSVFYKIWNSAYKVLEKHLNFVLSQRYELNIFMEQRSLLLQGIIEKHRLDQLHEGTKSFYLSTNSCAPGYHRTMSGLPSNVTDVSPTSADVLRSPPPPLGQTADFQSGYLRFHSSPHDIAAHMTGVNNSCNSSVLTSQMHHVGQEQATDDMAWLRDTRPPRYAPNNNTKNMICRETSSQNAHRLSHLSGMSLLCLLSRAFILYIYWMISLKLNSEKQNRQF